MKIPTITTKEVMGKIARGEQFKLIDVLSADHFMREHIRGAISLPAGELAARIESIVPDRDETIIVYCAGFTCQAGTRAARTLIELGYRRVFDYQGGLEDFKASGGIVENLFSPVPAAEKPVCRDCTTC